MSVRDFYDALAPWYHLVYQDWDSSIARQGDALSALIVNEWGSRVRRVIDASVGVGTQALGLVAKGHDLIGSGIRRARLIERWRSVGASVAAPKTQLWQDTEKLSGAFSGAGARASLASPA